MKKAVLVSVLSLVLLIGFRQNGTAGDLPKQGTFSLTVYAPGTWEALAMGEARLHATYNGIGVAVNDAKTRQGRSNPAVFPIQEHATAQKTDFK